MEAVALHRPAAVTMGLLMKEAVVSSPSVFAVALMAAVVAVRHLPRRLPRHLGPRLVQMADQVGNLALVLVALAVLVALVVA